MTCAPAQPRIESLEDRTLLSTCHVTRLTDQGIGKGFRGDLRYCIDKVNAESGPDVIDFTVTGTINLTSALPDLASEIDVLGPGADLLTVRRSSGQFRIFMVGTGATVSIVGLTIADGIAPQGNGGGIWNAGILHMDSTRMVANTAGFAGGAVYNAGGAKLSIADSTLSDNLGQYGGGGIFNAGTLVITGSAVTNNIGGDCLDCYGGIGGGIWNDSTATITNSTISGNSFLDSELYEDLGGGIRNRGTLTIAHSTITDNEAWEGGGIFDSGTLVMWDTILAGNNVHESFFEEGAGRDLFGALDASGYNLIGDTSGGAGFSPTDLLNVNPRLGPLQDNGGPTLTHALLPGSPAIDAGDNTGAPEFDQRGPGFPRIVNGTIDIGAFEVQSSPSPLEAPARLGFELLALALATADLESLT